MRHQASLSSISKPSMALRLVFEATAILLQAGNPDLTVTWHQVLEILQHAAEETLCTLQKVCIDTITGVIHERIIAILEDERFDASAAVAEGGSVVESICEYLQELENQLLLSHHKHDLKTLATPSFGIFVDGSRNARLACDVALSLRRSGEVHICFIDEFAANASYSLDFVVDDFTQYCRQNQVPKSKMSVKSQAVRMTQSMTTQLVELSDNLNVNFAVLGTFGGKGPQPTQIGNTAMGVVLQSSTSVILVPPIADTSRKLSSHVFVIAMNSNAESAHLCYNNALKLIKPHDTIHIVHIEPDSPLTQPPVEPDEFKVSLADLYTKKMASAKISGTVVIVPRVKGRTPAELIQAYIHEHKASYLIFGLGKHSSTSVGNVASGLLASPRCTLVICKSK
ncbi:hypothetical protein THRCLA_09149 [Thraustotheca clavata]|uniref:UspA domain-containing protein n=1 Tax=Thraustotheca clavata TaxID=74557 RepID=A0A1V9YYM6_9STRA|nr:hypothetical protein THRCLA_09149 [Thraustotheca clavata]